MSIPISIKGTIIDFPSSGENPNWAPAVIQFAEAVSNAFESTLVINTVSSNYVATANDDIIRVDATSGPISITLPTPNLVTGKIYYIQKIDSSGNAVTVVATINGQSNFVINNQYELISVYSDGTAYDLITHTILANVTILTKNSNYTVTSNDSLIRGDSSSGVITLTLPAANSVTGKFYYFLKIDSSSNHVIIGGTINGVSNFHLTNQYQAIIIYSNGTNYEIIGKSLGLTNADLSGSAGITGANIASATITGSNIASNTIANSNLSQAPTLTLKGNNTGGTANVSDLTISQINTMLGDVTTVGAFSATPVANGLDISGNTISLHAADATHPGALTILAQSIAGVKTFSNDAFFNSTIGIGTSATIAGQLVGSLYSKTGSSGFTPSADSDANLFLEADGITGAPLIAFRAPTNIIQGLLFNEGTVGGGGQFRYTWTGTASTSMFEWLANTHQTVTQLLANGQWIWGQAGSSVTHRINGATSSTATSGSNILPSTSIALYLPININGTVYKIPCYNN